jgi:methylated-DNA-protein-cysteine methyltransferase-like protein
MKRYGWDPSRDLDEEELMQILDDAAGIQYGVSERLLGVMRNDPASPMRNS